MKCPACKTRMEAVNDFLSECPSCDNQVQTQPRLKPGERMGLLGEFDRRFAGVEVVRR